MLYIFCIHIKQWRSQRLATPGTCPGSLATGQRTHLDKQWGKVASSFTRAEVYVYVINNGKPYSALQAPVKGKFPNRRLQPR